MQPKAVSITLWSFATLQAPPLKPVLEALEDQLVKVAFDMDPQAAGRAGVPRRASGDASTGASSNFERHWCAYVRLMCLVQL